MIVHTCHQVAKAVGTEAVVVCADDQQLSDVVTAAGYRAVMTSPDHQSGTDRIAEVAAQLDADLIVNVQGDEPEIEPAAIQQVIDLLQRHSWAGMATLAVASTEQEDPNAVKVILGNEGRALWFSRAPVVWDRAQTAVTQTCWRHVGIYAYRRDVLLSYGDLPVVTEQLEQLQGLAAGIGIACGIARTERTTIEGQLRGLAAGIGIACGIVEQKNIALRPSRYRCTSRLRCFCRADEMEAKNIATKLMVVFIEKDVD